MTSNAEERAAIDVAMDAIFNEWLVIEARSRGFITDSTMSVDLGSGLATIEFTVTPAAVGMKGGSGE